MTAVMLTRPDAYSGPYDPRMDTLAAWLLLLPAFTTGALLDVGKAQGAGLAILAFTAIVICRRPVSLRAAATIYVTFTVLALVLIGRLVSGSWPAFAGTAADYDRHALVYIGTYTLVAVYAGLFYREDVFTRVMWRAATLALWAGIVLLAVSRVTGHSLLANANYGALRMSGPLQEPSAWAAPLTVILLLAIRRRSKLYILLALAGEVLADSPTCLLVLAVTVPVYCVLTGRPGYRAVLLAALAGIIAASVLFVQRADYQHYEASGSTAEVALGRLVSGIRNVETGGADGQNGRFQSAQQILALVSEHGWERYGAGPAASSVYLPAVYPAWAGPAVAANSLWLEVLFDFGAGGVAVLGLLMLTAGWRMRRYPAVAAILLPSLIASLVNSSTADTLMAALAIMLFVPGYAGRQEPRMATKRWVP